MTHARKLAPVAGNTCSPLRRMYYQENNYPINPPLVPLFIVWLTKEFILQMGPLTQHPGCT
ncbi:MAG: hypothetical protein K0R08_2064 [Solimicrobium sp.]|jgi:hypothetical protein|nr:hypothetical protein [Solimicrobium sp.]